MQNWDIIGIISLYELVLTGSSTLVLMLTPKMDAEESKKNLPGFFGCVHIYPLLSVFSLKCVVTLPFDVKVLQRSSDISENSTADFTFIIHFYLRCLKVLYGNKSVSISLYYMWRKYWPLISKGLQRWFIYYEFQSHWILPPGWVPSLKANKLGVNTIRHLYVPVANIKSCAQCRKGPPSVVFNHADKVSSLMIMALLSYTNVCPLLSFG